MANTNRAVVRAAIHQRIRRKVKGSTGRPRLAIYRSLNHIYAQVIDDREGQTLVSASTTEKALRGNTGGNLDAAPTHRSGDRRSAHWQRVSKKLCLIAAVIFITAVVKALTDAARAAGLNKNESAAVADGANEKAASEDGSREDAAQTKEGFGN
jgi:large subunit ribosomal protein L18